MHSSVNEIHHHPSDSFVTFSTGSTGQPQDHIPRTRTSRLKARRDTIFSHVKCLGNISACFTHKHTHLQLPLWSKDRHYASSFKLHQTKKQ